jgi:hypothetical protein
MLRACKVVHANIRVRRVSISSANMRRVLYTGYGVVRRRGRDRSLGCHGEYLSGLTPVVILAAITRNVPGGVCEKTFTVTAEMLPGLQQTLLSWTSLPLAMTCGVALRGEMPQRGRGASRKKVAP